MWISQTFIMWTTETLPLSWYYKLSCFYVTCYLNQVIFGFNTFIVVLLDFVWERYILGMVFLNDYLNILFGKPVASNYFNYCHACLFDYLGLSWISAEAWCFIISLFICYYCDGDLLYLCNLPPRDNSNTVCIFTISILLCGRIYWSSSPWLLFHVVFFISKRFFFISVVFLNFLRILFSDLF